MQKNKSRSGWLPSGGWSAFLRRRGCFFFTKSNAICAGFGGTGEAGSAPAEQKPNLECSSKGC